MADYGVCSQVVVFFNRKRKRACRTKPGVAKKDDTYRLYFDRRRKIARRSKVIAPTNNRHVHGFILTDMELNWRALMFQSASGEGKEEIESRLASFFECKNGAALLGCGTSANYEKLGGIRRGAFGAVHLAVDKRTLETVAMKEQLNGTSSILTLREVDILKSLPSHPNIVGFREATADAGGGGVCIVMEHVEFDLRRYMKAADTFSTADAKMLMLQLLEGVKHLHDHMIMHRDLKPSNILVTRLGEVKICDFGLSRRLEAEGGAYSPKVGTRGYRAPEMENGMKEYWGAVDMWAVGCVMAEMLTGCCGDCGLLEEIRRLVCDIQADSMLRSKVFMPQVVSDAGFDLVRRLLNYDPCGRITAEEALNHAWFDETCI